MGPYCSYNGLEDTVIDYYILCIRVLRRVPHGVKKASMGFCTASVRDLYRLFRGLFKGSIRVLLCFKNCSYRGSARLLQCFRFEGLGFRIWRFGFGVSQGGFLG